jgi:hypothetical protein
VKCLALTQIFFFILSWVSVAQTLPIGLTADLQMQTDILECDGIYYSGPHAELLANKVSRLEKSSPAIETTLSCFRDFDTPVLIIRSLENVTDPSGQSADGINTAYFRYALKHDVTGRNITDTVNAELTTLLQVDIMINTSVVFNNRRLGGVLIHEIGHADDAVMNPGLVAQEGYNYTVLNQPYLPMAERPEEIRNIDYIDRVLDEIRRYDRNRHWRERLNPTRELP